MVYNVKLLGSVMLVLWEILVELVKFGFFYYSEVFFVGLFGCMFFE